MGRVELRSHPVAPETLELVVDGVPQSQIEPGDPARLHYEYTRRIGNVIDLAAPPGAPLRTLHLGGGGLTLARYVDTTRPGSVQTVVESDAEVVRVVLDRVPLPAASAVEIVVGDALDASRRLPRAFELVIVDAYVGLDTPGYVEGTPFFDVVARLLVPGGTLVVNVADGPELTRLAAQTLALAATGRPVLALGSPAFLAGLSDGNAILVSAPDELLAAWRPALLARGPHPVEAIDAGEQAGSLG